MLLKKLEFNRGWLHGTIWISADLNRPCLGISIAGTALAVRTRAHRNAITRRSEIAEGRRDRDINGTAAQCAGARDTRERRGAHCALPESPERLKKSEKNCRLFPNDKERMESGFGEIPRHFRAYVGKEKAAENWRVNGNL